MSSKMERANEAMRTQLVNARTNARENQDDLIRKGAGLAGAFVLGSLRKSGKITSIPTIPGVPRTIMISVVANVAGMSMPKRSKFKMALDGLGESSLAIAAYEWGQGGEVAGASELADDARSIEGRRRKQRMARQIEDRLRTEINRQIQSRETPGDEYTPGEFDDYIIDVPA